MAFSEATSALVKLATRTFERRGPVLSLWQEIAENFYPERANFTHQRRLGSEYAEHLSDSYPVLVRRDMADSITSMLRPTSKDWGAMTVLFEDELDNQARRWLEWAWKRQRRAMYERASNFTRATKEGDHDFATFGQCVVHVTMNRNRNGLLFRTQSLRDVAWVENEEMAIDTVFVRKTLSARDLTKLFASVAPEVERLAREEPFKDIHFMHMVVPSEQYPDLERNTHPFVSLYVDLAHQHVMEAVPSRTVQYVIPRWQTVSGSQYAFSPATITALPDARLIQAMTLVLLEAGEKFVDPPLVATQEAVRSDVALYAGGITWVDRDYDERLGDALRPITTDKNGLGYGIELSDRQKQQLRDSFYLNQISGVPRIDKTMTAYEAAQHVEQYIRQATPLFEPMEHEYNGGLCEQVFMLLLWNGAFGALDDIPEELQGREIEFKFKSPLHDAEGREKGTRIMELNSVLEPLIGLDPTVVSHFDVHSAFRDAMEGLDVPSEWVVDEDVAAENIAAMQQQQQVAQALQMAEMAGGAGKQLAETEEMARG